MTEGTYQVPFLQWRKAIEITKSRCYPQLKLILFRNFQIALFPNDDLMHKWLYCFLVLKGIHTPVKKTCFPMALEWQLCNVKTWEIYKFVLNLTIDSFWTTLF